MFAELFSNQERPISCPDERLSRPFSSKLHQGGLCYKPYSAMERLPEAEEEEREEPAVAKIEEQEEKDSDKEDSEEKEEV